MSLTAAVVAGIMACAMLIFALDRLFRPRGEKLADIESFGDSAGGDGGSGTDCDGGEDGGGGD